ncbi:AMP-binding protein, partial [Micrococcus sp. SIMBA_131]
GTIGSLFLQTVKKYGKEEALVDVDREIRWSYDEWNVEVNRLSNALIDAGVKKGDRVSTFLFNTIELATLFFSCAKIGAVLNPINFRLKSNEIAYIIEDAKPSIFVFEPALAPVVAEVQERYPDVSFWSTEAAPGFADSYSEHVRL